MILTQREYDALIADADDIDTIRRRRRGLVQARDFALSTRAPRRMVEDFDCAIRALDRAAAEYVEALCDAHGGDS